MQLVFNLFSDRRYYRENLFLSSNYMGLGTGVRGGRNPPLPISSLELPPPSLPPFPANFFFSSSVEGLLSGKVVSILCLRREKKSALSGEKGKMRPCAIFCEERGAGLQRQGVISRAGKGEFQTQLLTPHTPPFSLFCTIPRAQISCFGMRSSTTPAIILC